MKRAQASRPQPAAGLIDSIPEPEFLEAAPPDDVPPIDIDDDGPDSQLQRELRDSIYLAEAYKNPSRQLPSRYQMMQGFAGLKKRYQAIGFERTYYGYLAQYGVRHSNEFKELAEARACYKQMSLDVSNREVRGRRR